MKPRRMGIRWAAALTLAALGLGLIAISGRVGPQVSTLPPVGAAPLSPPDARDPGRELAKPFSESPSLRLPEHAPGARLPAAGRFLIASRDLRGPFFAETVILLLDYSAAGALGLVINRPTPTLLGELLPEVARLSQRRDRVHLGGPVDPRMMTFLIRSETRVPGSVTVAEDVYATSDPAALRAIIQSAAPASHFHAFVGYSGWGPGQLDNELERGDWHVGVSRAEWIFDDSPADLWQRIVVEFEGIQVGRPGPGLRLALR